MELPPKNIPEVSGYVDPFSTGSKLPKESRYGWTVSGEMGEYRLIHKDDLRIDYSYQRDNIAKNRINTICREWSWVAFGVITVAQRSDGSLWVMDGQHRLLASRNRSDITTLPCLVFKAEKREEALAFHAVNTLRGPVDSYHRFRALLTAGDPLAVAVNDMVKADGYELCNAGARRQEGNYKIGIISTLTRAYAEDPDKAKLTWSLCVMICPNGESISQLLFEGIFLLAKHLPKLGAGSVFEPQHVEKLVQAGQSEILRRIAAVRNYRGAGGEKTSAQGIITVLNHKRKNRIPDLC